MNDTEYKESYRVVFVYNDRQDDAFVGFDTPKKRDDFYEQIVFSLEAMFI